MGLNTEKFDSFAGGLNTLDSPSELLSDEAQDASNFVPVGRGEKIRSRKGSVQLDDNSIPVLAGSNKLRHIWAWDQGSGNRKILVQNGDALGFLSSVGHWTQIHAGGGGAHWMIEFAQDSSGNHRAWATNGTNPIRIDTTGASVAWGGVSGSITCLRFWKGYMVVGELTVGIVGTSPGRLGFSAIGDPETYSGADILDLRSPMDEADHLRYFLVFGDDLWVFKDKSIWRVTTPPPTVDNLKLFDQGLELGVGGNQVERVAVLDNKIFFLNDEGVWSTTGDVPAYESQALEGILKGRVDGLARLTADQGNGCLYLLVPSASGHQLFVGYPRMTNKAKRTPWYPVDLPQVPNCVVASEMTQAVGGVPSGVENKVYGGFSTTRGHVADLFSREDNSDWDFVGAAAVNFVSTWLTSRSPIQGTENYERVRRVNVEYGAATDPQGVSYAPGSLDLSVVEEFTPIIPAGLGLTVLGADGGIVTWRPESRARFHAFRVKFSATAGVPTFGAVSAIEVKYRGGKEH